MNVEEHIKSLLYRYECVVLPDFGAFLTQRKPAYLDNENEAFLPPQKTISFNRQLSENDGLLANYIAKVEKISYPKALFSLREYSQKLHSTLLDKKKKEIKYIGTFSLENDKILFEPFYQCNYLLDSYGMSSVPVAEIEREKARKVYEIPAEKKTQPYVRKNNAWKYAAAGAVLIGLSSFLTANWYSSTIIDHNMAEQQKAETQVEQKIQEATFVIDAPLPEITFKVAQQSGKYHIVAGAFRNEENAQKKVSQLQEKGFKARQIAVNKYGLHQVIYSSYENRLEALRNLRKIKHSQNQEAWLLVKELK